MSEVTELLPEMSQEELAAWERDWIAATWVHKTEEEARWRAQGYAVAWIDPEPAYMDICGWNFYCLNEPDHACIRTIRFALKGGGQIRVREKFAAAEHRFRAHHSIGCPECNAPWDYGTRILIKAETPAGLVEAAGRIHGLHDETNMDAIVLQARHQALADRAAETLRLILGPDGMPDSANFVALLDGSEGCAFCQRPLRDEVSKLIGIGPDCARQNGIPHNTAAANAVLARRRALLAAA